MQGIGRACASKLHVSYTCADEIGILVWIVITWQRTTRYHLVCQNSCTQIVNKVTYGLIKSQDVLDVGKLGQLSAPLHSCNK